MPLADITPLSSQFQIGLFSVLGIVIAILTIFAFYRRRPSLDVELVALQLSIKGLTDTVDKLTKSQDAHASHATEIEQLKRQVAQLEERRESDLESQRSNLRETASAISQAIGSLKDSFSHNIQAMERALGKLEGGLEGIGDRVARLEEVR